jgi:hypothetical protein
MHTYSCVQWKLHKILIHTKTRQMSLYLSLFRYSRMIYSCIYHINTNMFLCVNVYQCTPWTASVYSHKRSKLPNPLTITSNLALPSGNGVPKACNTSVHAHLGCSRPPRVLLWNRAEVKTKNVSWYSIRVLTNVSACYCDLPAYYYTYVITLLCMCAGESFLRRSGAEILVFKN